MLYIMHVCVNYYPTFATLKPQSQAFAALITCSMKSRIPYPKLSSLGTRLHNDVEDQILKAIGIHCHGNQRGCYGNRRGCYGNQHNCYCYNCNTSKHLEMKTSSKDGQTIKPLGSTVRLVTSAPQPYHHKAAS